MMINFMRNSDVIPPSESLRESKIDNNMSIAITIIISLLLVAVITEFVNMIFDQQYLQQLKSSTFTKLLRDKWIILKYSVIITTICVVSYYTISYERILRYKLIKRTQISAVNSYITQKQSKISTTLTLSKSKVPLNSNHEFQSKISDLSWVNEALESMWIIDKNGGLGAYLSLSAEEMLNKELAKVPPGIARLKLKKFTFGIDPPVIRSIFIMHNTKGTELCIKRKAKRESLHEKTKGKAVDKIVKRYLKTIIKSLDDSYSNGDELRVHSRTDKTTSKDPFSSTISYRDLDPGCSVMVADVEFGYISKNLEIMISLSSPNDIQHPFNEVTLSLTELAFAGHLEMNIDLIPEYPFLGNSTFSFKELPSLDMSISGLGSVDLSGIPGVFTWVNSTMTWLLDQYTFPNFGTMDMKLFLCPSCVKPLQAIPKSLLQKVIDSVQQHYVRIRRETEFIRKILLKLYQFVCLGLQKIQRKFGKEIFDSV